ncbi:MAG TPA: carbohydrate binding domain-containing protein [Bacteroidota bacterium]|nr:carbohydrate binding domain-containing protein [Bacteroidota bacterium]
MRCFWFVLPLVLLFCSCAKTTAQPGVTSVWAIDDGEKVKQDDLSNPAKNGTNNPVWDGKTVSLFGAKNETVAFQLILEASGSGSSNVNVILDSLVNGTSVITNTSTAGPFYYVGRYIDLYVEHYTNITQRSPFDAGYGFYNSRPIPDDEFLGWIPDALVPFEAPVKSPVHGQGGAPFPIAGGNNQAVWVDIYIPKDAVAGTYAATVTVTVGGSTAYTIPLTLKVYNFSLPDETHAKTFFSWDFDLLVSRYGLTYNTPAYWDMFRKFMNFSHRHRIDLVDGRQSLANFENHLAEYYTGTAYTAQHGYDGPGVSVGNKTYSIGTYDQPSNGQITGFDPATESAWQSAADAWEGWFESNAPDVLRFKYMDDEADVTNPAVVQLIQDKCSWIKSSPGPGKNLHRFFTKEFVYQGFYDYIDIWSLSAQPGIRMSDLAARKPAGDLFSTYNGTRPMWGNMELIDDFATDSRVNPWISWKYGIDLFFFWTTSFYAENPPPSPNAKNVWDDNCIPGGTPYGSTTSWGAGMVFYPGTDIIYPNDSRGVQGPIGCIRLNNMRRGEQDYEYLWLAKQAGIDVTSFVNKIVPHALDDWGDSYTAAAADDQQPVYAQHGYLFEQVRRALADSLASRSGEVAFPPTGTLIVDPTSLPAGGGTVSLKWSSTNATAATLNNGLGTMPVQDSITVNVTSSTSFVLTLTGPGGSIQYVASVSVGAAPVIPSGDVVTNSGFEDGTNAWYFFTNGGGSFTVAGPSIDGSNAVRVSITAKGTNTQLYQYNLILLPATKYQLSFDAFCNSGDSMDVSIGRHDSPYTPYGLSSSPVALTNQWATYTINFTTANFTDTVSNARLRFTFDAHAKAGDQYWLDNIVLMKVGSTGPPPVVLSTPQLIFPLSGATDLSQVMDFVWHPVQGATAYQFELASDSLFSQIIVNDSTVTDTVRQVRGLSFSTRYFLRLRALSPTGVSGFSSVANFRTQAAPPSGTLAAPLLSTPSAGATNVSLAVSFAWERVLGATKYYVEVATDPAFAARVLYDSATSGSRVLTLPGYLTTYYWRVRASNGASLGSPSEIRFFTTQSAVLPTPFAQLRGSSTSNQSASQTVSWSPVQGAETYQVQLAADSLFTMIVANDSSFADTTRTFSGLLYQTRYFLRIRAVGPYGRSPYAPMVAFTTPSNPSPSTPTSYALEQNYPNPFNPQTTIRYSLPEPVMVRLILFTITGQIVKYLVSGVQQAGYHEVHLDARNLASGTYFYWLEAGYFSQIRRLLLLK